METHVAFVHEAVAQKTIINVINYNVIMFIVSIRSHLKEERSDENRHGTVAVQMFSFIRLSRDDGKQDNCKCSCRIEWRICVEERF